MTIRNRRQRLDFDRNRVERVLGLRLRFRDHHRDRLADVAHLVPGDDRLKIGLELGQVREPQRDHRHASDIPSGHDRMHARHGTGSPISVRTFIAPKPCVPSLER
jgi:hypothetical protein